MSTRITPFHPAGKWILRGHGATPLSWPGKQRQNRHPADLAIYGFDDRLCRRLNGPPLPPLPRPDHMSQAGEGSEVLAHHQGPLL
jgi:hypothetical protein